MVVACGPGNNGGDGFVAARLLAEAGWDARVALLGSRESLRGDAAVNAGRWPGPVAALDPAGLAGAELVVDALFGAGLARDLDGAARDAVAAMRGKTVVAVDVPSGLDGATGQIRGATPEARLTITFFRKKPGHLLLPGRHLCGELVLADIGIPDAVLPEIGARTWQNAPAVWAGAIPPVDPAGHKYGRGHVLVLGGEEMTGAARLAARAAQRVGAGLVTVAAPPAAWPIYAASLQSIMASPRPFAELASDERRNALLVGPGAGRGETTREAVLAALATRRAVVLDADALTVFEGRPETLFQAVAGPCVLTPHSGEIKRLFPSPATGSRMPARRPRQAAPWWS